MEFNKLKQHKYLSPLIITVCLCVGHVIKTSFVFIDNKYIPLVAAILGTVLSIWQNGINPKSIVCGLVSGLASTGAFELIKNISEVLD